MNAEIIPKNPLPWGPWEIIQCTFSLNCKVRCAYVAPDKRRWEELRKHLPLYSLTNEKWHKRLFSFSSLLCKSSFAVQCNLYIPFTEINGQALEVGENIGGEFMHQTIAESEKIMVLIIHSVTCPVSIECVLSKHFSKHWKYLDCSELSGITYIIISLVDSRMSQGVTQN